MGVNGSREDESVMGILVKRFNECTAHKNVLNDGSSNRAKSLKNLRHLQKKAARSLPLFCTNFVYFFPHKVKIQEQNYWRIFATLYIFSNHLRIPFNLPHSFRYWTGFYMCEAKFIWSWREKKPHRININHVKNSEKERKLLK